jgi:hypothetical protein
MANFNQVEWTVQEATGGIKFQSKENTPLVCCSSFRMDWILMTVMIDLQISGVASL